MKDLKEIQKDGADLALKIAESYKIELDYSSKSIKSVEQILSLIHEEFIKTKDETGLRGLALEFAAYIVTVIEKNVGQGTWERDSQFGKDTFPYKLENGKTIFPYAWCMKRIIDGPGDDVWFKFKGLVLEDK